MRLPGVTKSICQNCRLGISALVFDTLVSLCDWGTEAPPSLSCLAGVSGQPPRGTRAGIPVTCPSRPGPAHPSWRARPLAIQVPRSPKVERSHETFCKPKWKKVKKQTPLIYMENISEHSQSPQITYQIILNSTSTLKQMLEASSAFCLFPSSASPLWNSLG